MKTKITGGQIIIMNGKHSKVSKNVFSNIMIIKNKSSEAEINSCAGCGAPVDFSTACSYCGNKHQEQRVTEVNNEHKVTKVNISGIECKLTVLYRKGSYTKKASVSGISSRETCYTDSPIKVKMSGIENILVVGEGVEVLSIDKSGSDCEVRYE